MRKNDVTLRSEHEAVRNRVGYYDFTMELIVVTGSSAAAFLDKIFVNSISKTKVGQAVYTTMLNEEAQILDDIIVFRLEDNKFWINATDGEQMLKWFDSHSAGFDAEYRLEDPLIMYAIQGPKSRDVLNGMLENSIDDLPVYYIQDNKVDGKDVKIARIGFTGELGYEIYFTPEDQGMIEAKLNENGKQFDIIEVQSDVSLTSLPAEKGYIQMKDVEGCNPVEAGLGWTVDWSKDFIGKDVLEKAKEAGITRRLVGFTVEDDAAEIEEGAEVRANGQAAGKVTNFTYGYTIEQNIGYALIDTTVANIGDKVAIQGVNGEIEATLAKRMFYDFNDERRKAAAGSAVR